MNNYEAIFAHKSVRKYKMSALPAALLKKIEDYCLETSPYFGDMEVKFCILNYKEHVSGIKGLAMVKAPYYLTIYMEPHAKALMNAGFIMQQISLYLCTLGLGSCFVGKPDFKKKYKTLSDGKELTLTLAFGEGRESVVRKPVEARRLSLDELCVFKEVPRQWMNQLLEAARMSPSSLNSQPWRFVVYDNRIHIFSVKKFSDRFNSMQEANFGILFANMMTVAEELWLDLDLIRLDNISQKNFPNTEYILSAILNT